MNIYIRRTLFILFITAFLIITPLTILYAAGYKVKIGWPPDFKQTLTKTGMFVFDTTPSGAKIFIDGEPSQLFFKKFYDESDSYIATPAKIKNILPGEYNVKMELPGYWPWEKKLTIEPGTSTYAEDIYLFKKNTPLLVANIIPESTNSSRMPVRKIVQSPNKKLFFILDEEKILIHNSEKGTSDSIPLSSLKRSIKANSEIIWSDNNEKILADKIIFNLRDLSKIIYLEDFITSGSENLTWNKDNSNEIYYRTDNSINSFNLASNRLTVLASGENYLSYQVEDSNLIFISLLNKTIKLKWLSLESKKISRELELPYSSDYKLINANHALINVYDYNHKILYLIDPALTINPIKEIINNIKYTSWVNDNKLLYANDFEIWLLEIDNAGPIARIGKKILTRISQPITSVLWHPNNNYLFFSTDKSLNVIEMDEREKRNVLELIKLDQIYSPYLDQKGEVIYLGATIDNQEGLYKLEIQ